MSQSLSVISPQPGSIVTHRLAILRCTAPSSVSVVTVTANSSAPIKFPVCNGKFIALQFLNIGSNTIQLSTPTTSTTLTLFCEPPPLSAPHVRLVYLLTSDSDGSFQSPYTELPAHDVSSGKERLLTAGYIIQAACAEMMRDQDLSARTFALDSEVHTVRLPFTTAEAHQMDGHALWSKCHHILSTIPHRNSIIDLCVMSFSRLTPDGVKAHTALGGSYIALFGGASLFLWPRLISEIVPYFTDKSTFDASRYFDDSAGRMARIGKRACTATTIGALLHEVGHCFTLHHPYKRGADQNAGIMGRGFDYLDRLFVENGEKKPFWDRADAVRLRYHPFFQFQGEAETMRMKLLSIDAKPEASPQPSAEIFGRRAVDGINRAVCNCDLLFEKNTEGYYCRSKTGIGMVAYFIDHDVATHQEFTDDEPKKTKLFSLKEIQERTGVNDLTEERVEVSAIDVLGNIEEKCYIDIGTMHID